MNSNCNFIELALNFIALKSIDHTRMELNANEMGFELSGFESVMASKVMRGYACDYSNKRQPMGFNEVKECCKGHVSMGEKIADKSLNYIGKRHMGRLMSDAYGRGIVRGQAENTNLRAYAKEYDVTLASLQISLKFHARRANRNRWSVI